MTNAKAHRRTTRPTRPAWNSVPRPTWQGWPRREREERFALLRSRANSQPGPRRRRGRLAKLPRHKSQLHGEPLRGVIVDEAAEWLDRR